MPFPPDLQIAQAASLKPLGDMAAAMGIGSHLLEAYGENVAKIKLSAIDELADRPKAKYVVVSAVTPTPLGEGKTTTTVGLGQAMCADRAAGHGRDPAAVDGPDVRDQGRRGRRRLQPGRPDGRAQPAPDRRLPRGHRGAQPAVGGAGQPPLPGQQRPGIDPHDITWRRVLDVNDRALRNIVVGLGSKTGRVPRQTGFDITAASEVMAIFALTPLAAGDARAVRRGSWSATRKDRKPVTAEEIGGAGAMAVIMRDALKPNLMQTLENTPVLVHAGPFGNIAHGNSSVVADLIGIHGGEFLDHRGRLRRRHGRRAVLQHQVPGVGSHARTPRWSSRPCGRSRRTPASTRSSPGGRCRRRCSPRTRTRSTSAGPNLRKQIENIRLHGVSPVVAINAFPGDHPSEHAAIAEIAAEMGARVAVCTHFTDGGRGAARAGRGRRGGRRRALGLPLPLPRLRVAEGEDRDDRDEGLRRRRGGLRPHGIPPARDLRGATATATSRSASPRPTCRCRPTRRSRARPRAGGCRSGRCGPRSVRGSSTRSAATCARCRASAPPPPRT